MADSLRDVVAYGSWGGSQYATVAIRRGVVGDCWVTRAVGNDGKYTDWAFRGAYVTEAQKERLREVYDFARQACALRSKCISWAKAHPGWDAPGSQVPKDVCEDLARIEDLQCSADVALEEALADGTLLAEVRAAEAALTARVEQSRR